MNYVECDVPSGMTLLEWRRSRRLPEPRTRALGSTLFARLRRAPGPAASSAGSDRG